MIFSGFNEKMPGFIEEVLQRLRAYAPDQETYDRFRDVKRREIDGWATQQPYVHTAYYHTQATETMQYPIEDLANAFSKATLKDLTPGGHGYILNVVTELGSHGTALLAGNVDALEATRLVQLVDRVFPFRNLPVRTSYSGSVRIIAPVFCAGRLKARRDVALSFVWVSRPLKSTIVLISTLTFHDLSYVTIILILARTFRISPLYSPSSGRTGECLESLEPLAPPLMRQMRPVQQI